MKTLTLYSREGCHLCERMIHDVILLQQHYVFQVLVVDIDNNVKLRERYNERVPLLVAGKEELCEYWYESAPILDYLQRYEDYY
jgi:hypothetical protein